MILSIVASWLMCPLSPIYGDPLTTKLQPEISRMVRGDDFEEYTRRPTTEGSFVRLASGRRSRLILQLLKHLLHVG
jgi:hypothetical protein